MKISTSFTLLSAFLLMAFASVRSLIVTIISGKESLASSCHLLTSALPIPSAFVSLLSCYRDSAVEAYPLAKAMWKST